MNRLLTRSLFCAVLFLTASASANEPQSLTAKIDGAAFAGDDDTILLVPLKDTFTFQAATAGAAAYPPPKTPIDRLSITCTAFTPGQPMKLGNKEFASSACRATFSKGASGAGKDDDEYSLDKAGAGILFEITASHGKVIEGRFAFPMKNKAGKMLTISDGHFVAEDRQL
jgi:hypothetical protein